MSPFYTCCIYSSANSNYLTKMVTWWPITKIVKTNVIYHNMATRGRCHFLYVPLLKLFTSSLKPIIRIKNDSAEIATKYPSKKNSWNMLDLSEMATRGLRLSQISQYSINHTPLYDSLALLKVYTTKDFLTICQWNLRWAIKSHLEWSSCLLFKLFWWNSVNPDHEACFQKHGIESDKVIQ